MIIQIKLFGKKNDDYLNYLFFSTLFEENLSELDRKTNNEGKTVGPNESSSNTLYLAIGLSAFILILIIIIVVVLYYFRKVKIKNFELENKISDLELPDSKTEDENKDVLI